MHGVTAALLLPRDEAGKVAWDQFERNASFVLRQGVSGLCVNGATGEYAGATREERRMAAECARRLAGRDRTVVSGVGATRWDEIQALANDAEEAGADAVLVPAPHFFRYTTDDLAAFFRRVAAEARVPVLIYNLPAFTGGIETELAVRLIDAGAGIVGVKDSSGELGLLERLTANHAQHAAVRIVGSDAVLAEALTQGIVDGTVSGVAGVLPELPLALWRSAMTPRGPLFTRLRAHLDVLLNQIDVFPTPWGLKLIAAERHLCPASLGMPVSAEREKQIEEFRCNWPLWWKAAEGDMGAALGSDVKLRAA